MAGAIIETRYRVGGMDCAACAARIETAVRRLPTVADVIVSVTGGTVVVRHPADQDPEPEVSERISRLGYTVAPAEGRATTQDAFVCTYFPPGYDNADLAANRSDHDHSHAHDTDAAWWASPIVRLTLAVAAALVVAWVLAWLVPETAPWGYIAATAVGLLPIARRAIAAARLGMPFTIETLLTVAALGAIPIGAAEEGATVVLLFLVGEVLEGMAAGRARAGIRSLRALIPRTAIVERDGRAREISADALAIGDTMLVRPGDRVPTDGRIIAGESAVDESPVTGESILRAKRVGDTVLAGTVVADGMLRVRVTARAADNTIAGIVALVEAAQEAKAPTQRFIDRWAEVYTPFVFALGLAVAVLPPLVVGAPWADWIYRGLAVLLVGCPCALVLSTPAAIAAALAYGARRGLLMKGGVVLERLGTVTMVAFDKTGTLTAGRPRVTDVMTFGGDLDEPDVLRLAAALEMGSAHPLAKAVLAKAAEMGSEPRAAASIRTLPGEGVAGAVDGAEVFLGSARAAGNRCELTIEQRRAIDALSANGKTIAVLVVAGKIAGLIAMRDEIRPDAACAVAALRTQHIGMLMLTGDDPRTGDAIARALGIEANAGLRPEDKSRIVSELKARGRTIAFVGDGINDAPALAAADVGIAMGGGTDVALETADAAILNDRLSDVPQMIDLARRTMANIRQNIAVALGLKVVLLATTLLGLTGLWPAILADTGATVLVTANALRLLLPRSELLANCKT